MKRPPPGLTIEQVATQLRKSGWFRDAELRILDERWQREAGDTADPRRYTRWLVARQYVTEQQLADLLRGLNEPPTATAAPVGAAVIVAPSAAARPDRRIVPTAAPAPPDVASPAVPVGAAPIEVELVPLHPPPPAPPEEPDISVELVPFDTWPTPATAESPPVPPPAVSPNYALYLLLGAAGLLLAEVAGWVAGYLIGVG